MPEINVDFEPEDYVTEQLALKTAVQNALRNFKKDPASRKTEAYFQTRLENLVALRAEFRQNHRKLIHLGANKEVQKGYFEAEVSDQFEEIYIEVVSTIREAFSNNVTTHVTNPSPSTSANCLSKMSSLGDEVPLPEVKLPTFNGKYIEWPTFKEMFLARVHNSQRLSDLQRFHYLKGSLAGSAAQDIQHICLIGENYQGAWQMLIDSYENNRILFTHYMDVFDQQPAVARDDPGALKRYTQTCRSCVNSLKKLGVNIDEQNHILVYYMLKKLPTAICNEWDHTLRKQKSIPTFTELCTLLDEQYQMMITSSTSSLASSTNQHSSVASRRQTTTPFIRKDIKSLYIKKKTSACPICNKEEHPVRVCSVFLDLSIADRRNAVQKFKLCFNCLGHNHVLDKCTSRRTCFICGGKHHTLIHIETIGKQQTAISSHVAVPSTSHNNQDADAEWELLRVPNYDVLLPTAIVIIHTVDGLPLSFRAFLDQGSQASFVTERVAQLLRLPRKRTCIKIHGLAEAKIAESRSCITITVSSRCEPKFNHAVTAYVLPKVGQKMPDKRLPHVKWSHVNSLCLADPTYFEPQPVDILLGNDVYGEIILNGIHRGESGTPIAQRTTFGYIVSGKVYQSSSTPTKTISSLCTQLETDHLLRKFWELEHIPDIRSPSREDHWCEELYQNTHQRLASGKYLLRLPLLSKIDSSSVIGSSRSMAMKRFLHLERRLARDPPLRQIYKDTIDDYLSLGQMKEVTSAEQQHQCITANAIHHFTCCYLPHHPIIKEASSTTKVRIVFDASAITSNGKSLNNILATGIPLQTDLSAVLINWRFFEFVFVADIEKMYRCIDLHDDDAQYQRILWRASPEEEIKEYFCSTVMFGTASAPFQAIRTMRQLASDEADIYPLAANVITNQMYVDDILSGGNTIDEAIETQRQVTDMLHRGTFQLRKWSSNHHRLLEKIPVEYRETKDLLRFNSGEFVKTLGMYWNPREDEFRFQLNFEISQAAPTKRNILSTIARLFDPLGWLNPVIISSKIILQLVWSHNLDWDSSVPESIKRGWKQYIKELPAISDIRVPRWLTTNDDDVLREVHVFCDASIHAYSAALYVRVRKKEGNYHTALLIAKCKVAPIKAKLTIPRAELCGAVLAINLLNYFKQHIRFSIDQSHTYLWTDSMIVLGWIRGDPSRWKVFIANRITKILGSSSIEQWRHISSEENPADCSSRGMSPTKLSRCELWWHGPSWLQLPNEKWPISTVDSDRTFLPVQTEMKDITVNTISVEKPYIVSVIEGFSSFSRLIRVIAYCKRFLFNVRHHHDKRRYGTLCRDETNSSLINIISIVQQDAFPNEWKALSSSNSMPKRSTLTPLNPFFDQNSHTIRVGGRLRESLLPANEKFPYILPTKHHFTSLVIKYSHLTTLHGGTTLTLSQVRKRFWIPNGRNAVRFAIHRCITCYRSKPKASDQLMADLPASRIRPARAFSSIGVDFAGPIDVLPSKGRGRTSVKGYIALFICLVTKAIHLEPVGDLSSNAFIGALQRFIGRRGLCRDIYSDCGTNFIGANRKLQANQMAYKTYIESQISPFLVENNIQWHFIPPAAPHFGGLWEAGVKSMKYHLTRSIGDKKLTFEELSTVLARIESCLNSRPLCPLSSDPNDLLVLTPGHFLVGDALLAPPVSEIEKLSHADRWKNCQFLVQQFWRRWSGEYLQRLQRRPKWLKSTPNVQINDVVLLKDERLPCNQWPLARIIETHPGTDGLVRVVTLKTKNGLFKRPVAKLCPLPTQDKF